MDTVRAANLKWLRNISGTLVQLFRLRTFDVIAQSDYPMDAGESLNRNPLELRAFIDGVPALAWSALPDGSPEFFNQPFLDHSGLSPDEVYAEWKSKLHRDDVEEFEKWWGELQKFRKPGQTEVRFRRADGEYRWFQISSTPVHDGQGRLIRWYGMNIDIDDRKRAEQQLRQKEEDLRTAIHKRSKRAAHTFVGVNCGAIPASLIASELFGHEKGAFTGATQRRLGRFEAASGGTIFLDEVGDLPPDVQIALLRVLQEREIERIGCDKPIPVDVRVVAATHRDMEKLVSEGTFRQDLLYRLNVVPIEMPSLRERASDIPLLVEYFIARFGGNAGKEFRTIDIKTLKLLQDYEWPGNVRELQNVIERAVILSDSDAFAVEETWFKRERSEVLRPRVALSSVLLKQEKEMIEAALAESRGRVSGPAGAAAKLGLPTRTLDSKIKRLGIDKYRFKSI